MSRHNRQLWLVPAEGRTGHHIVAEVAVAAPVWSLRTYAVPDELRATVGPGASLRVPYGRGDRMVDAVCVRVAEQPWDHTRQPILSAEAGPVWLSGLLLELGLWVSEYYTCAPWKTLTAMFPLALRKPRSKAVTYVRASVTPPSRELTRRQAGVLAAVGAAELSLGEVLQQPGVSRAILKTLCDYGFVERIVRRVPVPRAPARPAVPVDGCPEDNFDLTTGQQDALAQIRGAANAFGVFLLFGVPGSGKTEVYVRAIRDVIARGQQAILLIPEIALATQVVDRLTRRFARVAILHSQLTARVRRDTLEAVAAGNVDVVIGTRTAVFAPCPRLGLLIVDEEQETSFKNLAAPFYHARDVAIKRGQLEHVPVILGSATPALETWHNAQQRSHFRLLRLPERVPGARLPDVRLVESGGRDASGLPTLISAALAAQITETVQAGQQAILLHNRRGYAVFLRCTRCGLMVNCTRCGSHLVYHQPDALLKCHRCGVKTPVPIHCLDSTCGGALERTGSAIQRLEEDLQREFPQARLLRLDSDTMRQREDYRAALQRFEAGEADILLGTQMVAKGLDFPRVRLVGVIEADAALSLPDFRASERVFQLIVQVVGRAGRREGASLALVQTSKHPPAVIGHALRMDYEAFAAEELAQRQQHLLPPWTRMIRLICADARPHRAQEEAGRLAERLREHAGRIHASLRVDAAEACVIRQLREMLRYQVIVRGPRGTSVQTLLHEAAEGKLLTPRVQRFTIDVDPVDML